MGRVSVFHPSVGAGISRFMGDKCSRSNSVVVRIAASTFVVIDDALAVCFRLPLQGGPNCARGPVGICAPQLTSLLTIRRCGTVRGSDGAGSLSVCVCRPQAVTAMEYVHPTPIQAATVPVALLGRDICGCAATGTGKTAAFMLPILERLVFKPKQVLRRRRPAA